MIMYIDFNIVLPNGTIADSVIFAPEPLGTVAIDSKFPLEHYQKMVDKNLPQVDRNAYEKAFKMDVKKHIDAIAANILYLALLLIRLLCFYPLKLYLQKLMLIIMI